MVFVLALTLALPGPGCVAPRGPGDPSSILQSDSLVVFDHHVNVLSPRLVGDWKALGVPFGKPDYAYSDIDSIIKFNPADRMFLVSMAHLYGTSGFADSNELRNVSAENDYVSSLARKHPGKLFAFCTVHPLREYAAGEVLRARREGGAYGLELDFGTCGIDLTVGDHRRRVGALLSLASREGMPVMLDPGGSATSSVDGDIGILIDSLLIPAPPLELYIVHLGTSGGYTEGTRMVLAAFTEALAPGGNLRSHRIFFDLSAVGLTEATDELPALTPDDWVDLSDRLLEIGLERVVFGTDYPVFNTTASLRALEENLTLTREELMRVARNGPPGD